MSRYPNIVSSEEYGVLKYKHTRAHNFSCKKKFIELDEAIEKV